MKQEQNNEMDLLLRNLGRTPRADFDVDGQDDEHLDADELNAYAEKALPSGAQARYTKHIADCARCRKIAAQLGVAAGVITEKTINAPLLAPTGFKAFLASFLSPMVLRYSVPALALVLVAAVGLVVFQRSDQRFAYKSGAQSTAEPAVAQNKTQQATSNDRQSVNHLDAVNASTPITKADDKKPEIPKEQKTEADDSRQVKDAKNDQPITATDSVAAAAPGSAASGNAAEPPPAPKRAVAQEPQAGRSAPVVVEPSETVSVAKSNEKEKQGEKEKKSSQPTALAGAISGPNKVKSEVTRTRGRGDSAPRDEESPKLRESDDKDASETRSAGGRRFRKDGSVWVDVAYNGEATTNLSRGSEQYRALVADEPGIKTIADQLDGDVIIVWKGRAYKIK